MTHTILGIFVVFPIFVYAYGHCATTRTSGRPRPEPGFFRLFFFTTSFRVLLRSVWPSARAFVTLDARVAFADVDARVKALEQLRARDAKNFNELHESLQSSLLPKKTSVRSTFTDFQNVSLLQKEWNRRANAARLCHVAVRTQRHQTRGGPRRGGFTF